LKHFYKEKELENYIEVAVNYCKFADLKNDKYKEVFNDLVNICQQEERLDYRVRQAILKEIQS
jgi:DNA-directed RNA polymerase subunit F